MIRVENVSDLKSLKKGQGVMIGRVGKKKREEILIEAKKIGVKILNKYKKVTEAKK